MKSIRAVMKAIQERIMKPRVRRTVFKDGGRMMMASRQSIKLIVSFQWCIRSYLRLHPQFDARNMLDKLL
jgi:hypothetical protein